MIKALELRTALQTFLKTLHARVYFDVAPDDAVYPYVVFSLPNSIDSGSLEKFFVDVDVWDDKTDTTALETLIGTIDNALHGKAIIVDDVMSIIFWRENRLAPRDDDPRLHRRKYIYQARTYQKYY